MRAYEKELIDLGAANLKHTGRNFIDHLLGTGRLLESWGCDIEVIKAGIFHSAYGTNKFRHAVLDINKRQDLVEIIGEYSENLVYLFCTTCRPCKFNDLSALANSIISNLGSDCSLGQASIFASQLAEIEYANLLEQKVKNSNFLTNFYGREKFGEAGNRMIARIAEASEVNFTSGLMIDDSLNRTSIHTRIAVESDLKIVKKMLKEAFHKSRFSNLRFDDGYVSNAIMHSIHDPKCFVILAYVGSEPVGVAISTIKNYIFSKDSYCQIEVLYSRSEFRGLIGLRLMIQAKFNAYQTKASEIRLSTDCLDPIDRTGILAEKIGMFKTGGNYSSWIE